MGKKALALLKHLHIQFNWNGFIAPQKFRYKIAIQGDENSKWKKIVQYQPRFPACKIWGTDSWNRTLLSEMQSLISKQIDSNDLQNFE